MASGQQAQSVFPEPGLTVPRFHFNTGRVVNNEPEVSPVLPAIPGAASEWRIGQWNQPTELRPDALRLDDPQTQDPQLGVARFAFTARDQTSHVWIYRDQGAKSYVYDLYQAGGSLQDDGGANTFLGTKANLPNATLDREVDFDVKAKVSRATVSYETAAASRNGAVIAQAFWAFTLQYRDPETHKVITVFQQIPITQSRPGPLDYHACRIGQRGNMTFTVDQELPGVQRLPFAPQGGPLTQLHYRLNDYLCLLLARPYQCRQEGSQGMAAFRFSGPALDFANWRITATYSGLETQIADDRNGSRTRDAQGSAGLGIQISDFRVMRYRDRPTDFRACPSS